MLAREAAIILTSAQIRHLVRRGEVKAAEPVAENWASAPVRISPTERGVIVIQNTDPALPYRSADVDLLSFAAEQAAYFFRRREGELDRRQLAAAVEQAVDAILILDEQGRVRFANPAFTRQSGFERADVRSRPLDVLWEPSRDGPPIATMWECARGGRPWSGRIFCASKQGASFPADVTLTAVFDREGRVVQHVVVQHDVRNEVALEEQLRQAQKMEAIGLLAGGVAHDFNNLLCVIQGYGDLAKETITDPETAGAMDQVLDAARRASTLIGQLLAFSRRQVIEPQPLDLSVVVRDLEQMLRRLIGEDITLVVECEPEPDLVEADPHKIEQVLMNLVVNARDAMPRGGTLVVRTERVVVDQERAAAFPGLSTGRHMLLSVRDTGEGMSEETQKRIFEPFFTTKPAGQGTGLGLSTVYGFVKQAEGAIQVESALGRGTEFRIFLPSIACAPARAASPEDSQPLAEASETVLVAEDEPALREFVQRVLTKHGYRVLAAGSGAQSLALARAHEEPIDLLLTDVVMPNMNGSSLAATLAEERPGTAVLFMSGYPDSSIANYGVLDPDVDLLEKPFTSGRLLKRVRRALDTRRRKMRRTPPAARVHSMRA